MTTSSSDTERHSEEGPAQGFADDLGHDMDQLRKLRDEVGGEMRRRLLDEMRDRPFVALGVAFGAGAMLASIVSSRFARVAILAAGGYAAREMFGARIMEVLEPEREGTSEEPGSRRRSRRSPPR